MGSKNRIYLGIIADIILHFHRNFFSNKKIYMSKRVHKKIKDKHKDIAKFAQSKEFSILLSSIIASVNYKKDESIINFISFVESENKFILFALKREKHHTSCSTIFSLRPETLRKYYIDKSFRLFKQDFKDFIDRYIAD